MMLTLKQWMDEAKNRTGCAKKRYREAQAVRILLRPAVTFERFKDGRARMAAVSSDYRIIRNKGGAEARRATPKVRGKSAVRRMKRARRRAREHARRAA